MFTIAKSRALAPAVALMALTPLSLAAQSVVQRTPNLANGWAAAPGIVQFNLTHRFDISDAPPRTYVPQIRVRFSDGEWHRMQELHALPERWEIMPYPEFLVARRKLMADIVRRGFETLA